MGTSGTIGFRINEEDYLTYNHFDSYPSDLGVNVLEELATIQKTHKWKGVILNITNITGVDSNAQPSSNDIIEYSRFGDPRVSAAMDNKEIHSWYQLLRNAQGTLVHYMNGTIKHFITENNFIKYSLFCEYGYIVNFDTKKLEFWKGAQTKPDPSNRYGQEGDDEGISTKYYPCKLMHEFDLDSLPSKKEFLKITEGEDE